jgi:phosphatidylglycerol:prolipoprotein diacylglycerol transferase
LIAFPNPDPVLHLGPLNIRWYAMMYIIAFAVAYFVIEKRYKEMKLPLKPTDTGDLVAGLIFGLLIGARLGFVVFYKPEYYLLHPDKVLALWEGGMSFHGGFIGVMLALAIFARRHRLNLLRVCDYMACAAPFGLVLVRLANFVNGELWGRPSTLPWAMIFPGAGDGLPRHPSQLYEALLEGVVSAIVLTILFWKTDARHRPGLLFGVGLSLYGAARFLMEFFRQPDAGLENLPWGLTMGQTLSLPMLLVGLVFALRAGRLPPSGHGQVLQAAHLD